jgi:ribose transport system permease protein
MRKSIDWTQAYKFLPIATVTALFIVITLFNPSSFLSGYNITTLLDYATTYFVTAVGLTFVILIGSIDLSIGALLSLFTVCFATMLNSIGYWAYPAIACLGLGAGFINGIMCTKMRIPSFIGTFGAAGVYQSLALVLSRGLPVGLRPKTVHLLGFLGAQIGPVKVIHIAAALLFGCFMIVQKSTILGRYVYAIGNAENVAFLSGIKTDRVKNVCFSLSGLTAGLGAIALVLRKLSGDPTIGAPYTLQIIATVVVGGTALSGGIGGMTNTLIGTLIIVLIGNGLNVAGVNVYYQLIITGVIAMISVSLTLDRSKSRVVK